MARVVAALWLAFFALGCQAGEARKYAVLSLVGDEMLVVGAAGVTGQRLDRNSRNYLRLDDPIIDKTVLLAANEALKRATGADPVLLFAHERPMYAMRETVAETLALAAPIVKGTHATHLVLFTKARSEARMQLHNLALGNGMLEGVGFYVDPSTEVTLIDERQTATGFIGAFTYFDASLVDLASGKVVAERRVTASKTTAAPDSKATEVWSGISSQQKVRMLQALLREEIARAVPLLVKESNP